MFGIYDSLPGSASGALRGPDRVPGPLIPRVRAPQNKSNPPGVRGVARFPVRARRIDATGGSDVVVHLELVRMRAQANRIHLVAALVVHPGLDQIRREDPTRLQVVVVLLQSVEHLGE